MDFKPRSLSEMNAEFAKKLASSAEEKQVSAQTTEENYSEPQVIQPEQPIETAVPVQEATPPVEEAPVYEVPAYEAPVEETPVYEAPAYVAPVEETPVYEAPAYVAPVEEAPVYEAPAYVAPVYEAPVYEAPKEEGPEEEINLFEEVKLPIIDENSDFAIETETPPVEFEFNEPIPTGYFDLPKEPEVQQEEVAPVVETVPEVVPVVETAPEVVPVVEEAPEVVPIVETAPEVVPVVEPAPEVVPVVEEAPEVVPVVEEAPEAIPVEETAPEVVPVVETAPEVAPVAEPAPEVEPVAQEASQEEPKFDFEKENYYPAFRKKRSAAKIILNISIIAVIILSLLLGIAAFLSADPAKTVFGNGVLVCNNTVKDAKNLDEGSLVFIKMATEAANNEYVAVHQGDISEYNFMQARSMAEEDIIFAVAKSSLPFVGKLVSLISDNWIIFTVLAILILVALIVLRIVVGKRSKEEFLPPVEEIEEEAPRGRKKKQVLDF